MAAMLLNTFRFVVRSVFISSVFYHSIKKMCICLHYKGILCKKGNKASYLRLPYTSNTVVTNITRVIPIRDAVYTNL